MAYGVTGLAKSFGSLEVLGGLDLEFPEGSVTAVLGPSGCGKTTLLNILAGLDPDFSGSVEGFGEAGASYVFQEDRLLPWLSARDNVALVLERGFPKAQREALALEALAAVGLEGSAGARPGALSGGMRRRVAIARAFAYPSRVLLLDEPFSALDLKTRIAVMDLFLDLRARDGRTAIVVTHDVREAIYLGDRITTLSDRPARVRDTLDTGLGRADRDYASPVTAGLEARLYRSILS